MHLHLFCGMNVYFFRLHEVLMELQHQQLKQLADWLELTEGRIKQMGTRTLGPDFENIKQQVEEHKVGLMSVNCDIKLSFRNMLTIIMNT